MSVCVSVNQGSGTQTRRLSIGTRPTPTGKVSKLCVGRGDWRGGGRKVGGTDGARRNMDAKRSIWQQHVSHSSWVKLNVLGHQVFQPFSEPGARVGLLLSSDVFCAA